MHNDELYAVAVGVWQQAAALGVELYLYDTEGGLSVTRQPPPPPSDSLVHREVAWRLEGCVRHIEYDYAVWAAADSMAHLDTFAS